MAASYAVEVYRNGLSCRSIVLFVHLNVTYMQKQQSIYQSVEFITCDEEGKFVITPKGAEVLKAVNTDIAVIALAGLQRTGKSFLMNLLSRYIATRFKYVYVLYMVVENDMHVA